jgi:hypothetical protein
MRLKLELRPQPSRLMAWLSPLVAAAATLVAGFTLFSLLGKDALQAFEVFFVKPIETRYGLGELLPGGVATAVRDRARRGLSRQRVEHHAEGAADARRA